MRAGAGQGCRREERDERAQLSEAGIRLWPSAWAERVRRKERALGRLATWPHWKGSPREVGSGRGSEGSVGCGQTRPTRGKRQRWPSGQREGGEFSSFLFPNPFSFLNSKQIQI